jgi:PRTRC genetic system protein C
MTEHPESPFATPIRRLFIYDGREFPDPCPQFTPDEVRE